MKQKKQSRALAIWAAPEGELPSELGAFVVGAAAQQRFAEYFLARLSNPRTRRAYGLAILQFARWCGERGVTIERVSTLHVAAYVERLKARVATPTVLLHLAALRGLYNHLVSGGIVPFNPATAAKGPRYSVTGGKTPVLSDEQARSLIESIPTSNVAGLRDRALLAIMLYSAARVGAVCRMRVGDYFAEAGEMVIRLAEKGGKARPAIPVHSRATQYLDAYLDAAGIRHQVGSPLFRRMAKWRNAAVSTVPLNENAVLKAVKRRARAAGLPGKVSCHTFRATGITSLRRNGGDIEAARRLAGHASVETTRLYDRSENDLLREDVERIGV